VRVLLVQRSLRPPGGGNAVAAWMVHALATQHDVTTLTERARSPSETNAFYGTSIAGDAVTRLVSPLPWRLFSNLGEDKLTRLGMCMVLRAAAAIASHYDLMISADNFAPFPRPGIQYVHFPARLQPEPARLPALVQPYFALCDRVLGASWKDAANNLTVANSQWTADGLARLCELPPAIVIYPPVIDPGAGLPWAQRDDTFLCVGRFDASKRIETAISIVRKTRAAALPGARLMIVGSPVDADYTSRIRAIASQHQDWVQLREDLTRDDLNQLMGRSRYGIQAMEGEHFGMATAEMTRAGCLVFAHGSGGSPEVLNHEEALLWSTEEDAVRKIAAAAANDPAVLRARLELNARRFSTASFVEAVRDALRELAEARVGD
jgi:glycosyltransferase involved in cell wall biosynthesis